MKVKYKRPEWVKRYKKQQEFIDAPTKHAIVEATSKAGKTVGCIVWLVEQALRPTVGDEMFVNESGRLVVKAKKSNKEGFYYWWVAPINAVSKIAFRRMKRYLAASGIIKEKNDTELTITLVNGATIAFKSADNPDSLYGEDVYAAVLDESTRMKEDAYIAVDSTLTATEGPMRIIGNVKGIGNWSYRLAREVEANKLSAWSYYKLTAADAVEAGVLKQSVLDEKKQRLPLGVFLELYYAIPFVNSSNKFAYAFDPAKHVHTCKLDPKYPVYLSFDFNRNPICAIVVQYINGVVYVPKAFKLPNSDIYQLCASLWSYLSGAGFKRSQILIHGDASGNNGAANVKENLTYFRIIMSELKLDRSQMKQSASNPKIEENQVLVNAVLTHIPVQIDPTEASGLVSDLQFVEMLPDGSMKKGDRNDPNQQADLIDCLRYTLHSQYNRQMLKGELSSIRAAA